MYLQLVKNMSDHVLLLYVVTGSRLYYRLESLVLLGICTQRRLEIARMLPIKAYFSIHLQFLIFLA